MSRRTQRDGEIGFGSDSFLDIIANIVGILIILIVVAGVRVGNAPLQDLVQVEEEAAAAAPVPPVMPETVEPAAMPLGGVDPQLLPEPPQDAPERPRTIYVEAPAPEASPELLREVERLRRRLATLEKSNDSSFAKGRTVEAELAATRRELRLAEQRVADQERSVQATAADVAALSADLDRSRNLVVSLREETRKAETTTRNVEKVEHELTPVSRLVQNRELHFRLSGNRIAPVPLEELLDRLKSQVERQRDWLVKFRSHQGVVGPVDGFELKYVVQRQQLSSIDRLRGNVGVVRIGLSRWEVVPTDELEPETYDEAIASGSRFRRALGYAGDDTTLTLWVYPDSFEIYRRLQKVAHENDFLVAGRPLPDGVPIAGSPDGSRSSGQ